MLPNAYFLDHLGRNAGYIGITLLNRPSNSPSTCLPEKTWMDFKVSMQHGLHFYYRTTILTCKGMEVLWLHLPCQNATVAYFGLWRVERSTWMTVALKACGSFKIPLALGAMENISLKSLKFTAQPSAQFLLFHGFVLRLRSSSLVENCRTWKRSESVWPSRWRIPIATEKPSVF